MCDILPWGQMFRGCLAALVVCSWASEITHASSSSFWPWRLDGVVWIILAGLRVWPVAWASVLSVCTPWGHVPPDTPPSPTREGVIWLPSKPDSPCAVPVFLRETLAKCLRKSCLGWDTPWQKVALAKLVSFWADPVARFERHLILLKMNSQIVREPKLQVYQPLLIFLILQRCLH